MWLLTIEDEDGSSTYRRLSGECYTVGRASSSDIVLAQYDISRRHARFERQGERWLVVDEGSDNGTYVNGVRITTPTALGPLDAVRFGAYRARLSDGHAAGLPTPPPRVVLPARLRVLAGPSAGAEYRFVRNDVVMIGRGHDCSLRLVHERVGEKHAIVRALPGGLYEIEATGGPVFVNGRRLAASHLLEGGDAINVGGVALLRYFEPSEAPAACHEDMLDEGDAPPVVESAPAGAARVFEQGPSLAMLLAVPEGEDELGGDGELEAEPLLPAVRVEAVGPLPLPPPRPVPASYRVLRETAMPRPPTRLVEGGGEATSPAPVALAVEPSEALGPGWRAGREPPLRGLPDSPAPRSPAVAPPKAMGPDAGVPLEMARAPERPAELPARPSASRRRWALGAGAALALVGLLVGLTTGRLERGDGKVAAVQAPTESPDAGASKAEPAASQSPSLPASPPTDAPTSGTIEWAVADAAPKSTRIRGTAERPLTPRASGSPQRERLEAQARGGRASANELRMLVKLCEKQNDLGCMARANAQLQRLLGAP